MAGALLRATMEKAGGGQNFVGRCKHGRSQPLEPGDRHDGEDEAGVPRSARPHHDEVDPTS